MRVVFHPGTYLVRQQGVMYLIWGNTAKSEFGLRDGEIDLTSPKDGRVYFLVTNDYEKYPYYWAEDIFLV